MSREKGRAIEGELGLDQAARDLAHNGDGEGEVQLSIFREQSVFGTIRTPDGGEIRRSGPGRPRGSKNRTTTDLIRLIETTGRHPILAMAEIVATPIEVIAKTLGCSKAVAAEYHRKVMADLAPYVAQKLPTAIQLQGGNAGMLVINTGAPVDQAAIVGLAMKLTSGEVKLPVIDHEENQALSGDDDAPSHDAPSHG